MNDWRIFVAGIAIGVVLTRLTDILCKWSEMYCLNKQRKLDLLLGEAVLKMKKQLE